MAIVVLAAIGLAKRISVEDAALKASVGDSYAAYCAGRARRIPGLWSVDAAARLIRTIRRLRTLTSTQLPIGMTVLARLSPGVVGRRLARANAIVVVPARRRPTSTGSDKS